MAEEIPKEVDLYDRGIGRGETPRLWINSIAHVAMGRDKRMYRFLQDTRYGRKVLAESGNIPEIVEAVTKYLAQRLIERERALADSSLPAIGNLKEEARLERRRRRRRGVKAFVLGLLAGCAILIAAALLFGSETVAAPDRFRRLRARRRAGPQVLSARPRRPRLHRPKARARSLRSATRQASPSTT